MNVDLVVVGKTDSEAVRSLTDKYLKRVNLRAKSSLVTIPDIKNSRGLTEELQKTREGELILRQVAEGDYLVLLDDKGTQHTSTGFAAWLQKRFSSGGKRLVFVIGGPYGFSPEVYARAQERLSLSPMTFSHQIVRAIFAEQLYRAISILNSEPYHHE